MASQSRFLQFLLIFTFASAIVALGAYELHLRFLAKRDRSKMGGDRIIQYLHGEVDMQHASQKKRQEQEESEAKKESSADSDDESWFGELTRKIVP